MWDSFPAVVGCSLFSLLYGVFCAIQLVYLFGGGLFSLPDGLTYASYARTGFFQLLFVAFFNFCCVLLVCGRFRESRLLKGLLTFLCGCTFIMIASAAYRMLLYVNQYDLTFLRVLVLWFLLVLTVLLAGVLYHIYRRKMPLVRFLVLTSLFFWLLLVFSRPEFWIARYNVERGHRTEVDFDYVYSLSRDAAPAISGLPAEQESELFRYWEGIEEDYEARSLREWNLSAWLAHQAAKGWLESR